MRELPISERPRERLAQRGPGGLTSAELIALLWGSGVRGRSAVDLATDALAAHDGLAGLARANELELWNADAQVGWRFERRRNLHGWGGRLFLRYLLQSIDTRIFPFGPEPRHRVWRVNAGLSLNLF